MNERKFNGVVSVLSAAWFIGLCRTAFLRLYVYASVVNKWPNREIRRGRKFAVVRNGFSWAQESASFLFAAGLRVVCLRERPTTCVCGRECVCPSERDGDGHTNKTHHSFNSGLFLTAPG